MNVILAPVVTEKSVEDMKIGKYAFIVEKSANKPTIKKAVEKSFKVEVTNVATVNMKEQKRKTMQGRTVVKPAFKKAIIKVKDGQKIDVFNMGKSK